MFCVSDMRFVWYKTKIIICVLFSSTFPAPLVCFGISAADEDELLLYAVVVVVVSFFLLAANICNIETNKDEIKSQKSGKMKEKSYYQWIYENVRDC